MPNPINWEKEERRRKRRAEFIRHWNETEKIELLVRLKLVEDHPMASRPHITELIRHFTTGSYESCWTSRALLERYVRYLEAERPTY